MGIVPVACWPPECGSGGDTKTFGLELEPIPLRNTCSERARQRPSDNRSGHCVVDAQPSSVMSRSNAVTRGADSASEPAMSTPIQAASPQFCCARAASGHAAAAPPSSVMISRRFTRSPRRRGQAMSAAGRGRAFEPS